MNLRLYRSLRNQSITAIFYVFVGPSIGEYLTGWADRNGQGGQCN